MNYLLHKQKYPNSVVKLPDGLSDLVSDISREVLRCQPDKRELYTFISNYLGSLVQAREELKISQGIISQLLDNVMTVVEHLQTSGISLEKAEQASSIIRNHFEKFLGDKRKEQIKEGRLSKEFKEAELLADLVKQCKLTQDEILRARPSIQNIYENFVQDYLRALGDCSISTDTMDPLVRYTLIKYIKLCPTEERLNSAATKIQSIIRGFLSRRFVQRLRLLELTPVPQDQFFQFAKIDLRRYQNLMDPEILERYKKAALVRIQKSYLGRTTLTSLDFESETLQAEFVYDSSFDTGKGEKSKGMGLPIKSEPFTLKKPYNPAEIEDDSSKNLLDRAPSHSTELKLEVYKYASSSLHKLPVVAEEASVGTDMTMPISGTQIKDSDALKAEAQVTSDAPVTDAPVADTSVADATVADATVANVSVADAQVSDASVADAPVADAPIADAPITDVPVADVPAADASTAETPTAEAPTADAPIADAPTADAPTAEAPTAEAATAGTPTADAPDFDAPIGDSLPAEVPATETPTVEALTDEVPAPEAFAPEAPASEVSSPEAPEAPAPEASEAPAAEATPSEVIAPEAPAPELSASEAPALDALPAEATEALVEKQADDKPESDAPII